MSNDRRPAKVRVVSGGDAPTPARRRTDQPEGVGAPATLAAPVAVKSAGPGVLWIVVLAVLFLIGSVVGGGLLVLSGLAGPIKP